MYKILIKYDNDKFNLWMPYGSTTTSTTGNTTFTEFETDNIENIIRETYCATMRGERDSERKREGERERNESTNSCNIS